MTIAGRLMMADDLRITGEIDARGFSSRSLTESSIDQPCRRCSSAATLSGTSIMTVPGETRTARPAGRCPGREGSWRRIPTS